MSSHYTRSFESIVKDLERFFADPCYNLLEMPKWVKSDLHRAAEAFLSVILRLYGIPPEKWRHIVTSMLEKMTSEECAWAIYEEIVMLLDRLEPYAHDKDAVCIDVHDTMVLLVDLDEAKDLRPLARRYLNFKERNGAWEHDQQLVFQLLEHPSLAGESLKLVKHTTKWIIDQHAPCPTRFKSHNVLHVMPRVLFVAMEVSCSVLLYGYQSWQRDQLVEALVKDCWGGSISDVYDVFICMVTTACHQLEELVYTNIKETNMAIRRTFNSTFQVIEDDRPVKDRYLDIECGRKVVPATHFNTCLKALNSNFDAPQPSMLMFPSNMAFRDWCKGDAPSPHLLDTAAATIVAFMIRLGCFQHNAPDHEHLAMGLSGAFGYNIFPTPPRTTESLVKDCYYGDHTIKLERKVIEYEKVFKTLQEACPSSIHDSPESLFAEVHPLIHSDEDTVLKMRRLSEVYGTMSTAELESLWQAPKKMATHCYFIKWLETIKKPEDIVSTPCYIKELFDIARTIANDLMLGGVLNKKRIQAYFKDYTPDTNVHEKWDCGVFSPVVDCLSRVVLESANMTPECVYVPGVYVMRIDADFRLVRMKCATTLEDNHVRFKRYYCVPKSEFVVDAGTSRWFSRKHCVQCDFDDALSWKKGLEERHLRRMLDITCGGDPVKAMKEMERPIMKGLSDDHFLQYQWCRNHVYNEPRPWPKFLTVEHIVTSECSFDVFVKEYDFPKRFVIKHIGTPNTNVLAIGDMIVSINGISTQSMSKERVQELLLPRLKNAMHIKRVLAIDAAKHHPEHVIKDAIKDAQSAFSSSFAVVKAKYDSVNKRIDSAAGVLLKELEDTERELSDARRAINKRGKCEWESSLDRKMEAHQIKASKMHDQMQKAIKASMAATLEAQSKLDELTIVKNVTKTAHL